MMPDPLTDVELRVLQHLVGREIKRTAGNMDRNTRKGWEPEPGRRDANVYRMEKLTELHKRLTALVEEATPCPSVR